MGSYESDCNKKVRTVDFEVKAQVAQWAVWKLGATGWEWYVKKPGVYAADYIDFYIKSNGNITVKFEDFDNLKFVPETKGPEGVDQEIEFWFAYTEAGATPDKWYTPRELDCTPFLIEDSSMLHEGLTYKLWNKINVSECNTAGTYKMKGRVVLTLANQRPWIDKNGDYDKNFFCPEKDFDC